MIDDHVCDISGPDNTDCPEAIALIRNHCPGLVLNACDEPASTAVVEQVDSAVSDSHVVEDSSTQDEGPAVFDRVVPRDDGVVDVGAGADGMTPDGDAGDLGMSVIRRMMAFHLGLNGLSRQ